MVRTPILAVLACALLSPGCARTVEGRPQHYGAQLSGGTDEEISAAVAHDPNGIVLRRMHADLGLLPTLDGLVR